MTGIGFGPEALPALPEVPPDVGAPVPVEGEGTDLVEPEPEPEPEPGSLPGGVPEGVLGR